MAKLTAKQEIFVIEYLRDLNATQAAIRAGYSKKTADRTGPELLGKPSDLSAAFPGGFFIGIRQGFDYLWADIKAPLRGWKGSGWILGWAVGKIWPGRPSE